MANSAKTAREAYTETYEHGIKYVRNLIDDAVSHGYIAVKIPNHSFLNKDVIQHYIDLGYELVYDTLYWNKVDPQNKLNNK